MEKLANLTQTDINNGVLICMLANAGIPDVQEYVKTFHQKTEELIIEEFEHPNQNKIDNEEQIVPPTSIQNWITSLQPHFDDPTKSSLPEEGQQQLPQDVQSLITNLRPVINNNDHINSTEQQLKQQQHKLPAGVQDWITGLRPCLDDPAQASSCEQQQQKQSPTDFTSWIQRITPVDLVSSTDIIRTETSITSNNVIPVTGNLGTWLNDWSRSLADQPPPTSLDSWLQCLVPKDMNEPIGKAANPKGRLNTYLNVAQEVLSQHGYNVSNEVRPSTNVEIKTGTFGSVKQMYFLVRVSIFFHLIYLNRLVIYSI